MVDHSPRTATRRGEQIEEKRTTNRVNFVNISGLINAHTLVVVDLMHMRSTQQRAMAMCGPRGTQRFHVAVLE